jgi:hypothetical protein
MYHKKSFWALAHKCPETFMGKYYSILPAYDTIGYVFLEIKQSFSISHAIPGHSLKVSR